MHDDKEIRDLQEKMQDCIKTLRRLAPLVGAARQIKEFSSDQRKNALAAAQISYIQRGESVAASETLARSNPMYLEKMNFLEKTYADACGNIAEWEATFARFDACRSMLAMSRETLKTLEG
jgi:hypothetical protein